jgi:hypothetical protein
MTFESSWMDGKRDLTEGSINPREGEFSDVIGKD